MTPNIKTNRTWTANSVKQACIENGLYTTGTNEDYEYMLSWVSRLYPDIENMYFIAKDIVAHSEEQTISNVMFLLENRAVKTFFEIENL